MNTVLLYNNLKSKRDKNSFFDILSKDGKKIDRLHINKSNLRYLNFVGYDNLKYLWICSSALKLIDLPTNLKSLFISLYNINQNFWNSRKTPEEIRMKILENFTEANYKKVGDRMVCKKEFKIDISKNYDLNSLILIIPGLKKIDLSKNNHLKGLQLTTTLTDIDLTANKELLDLYLHSDISSIDLSQNNELTQVTLISYYLSDVDLTKCFKLENITLDLLLLKDINLSENKAIVNIFIKSDKLKNINISNNKYLTRLTLNCPLLENTNFSKNKKLEYIWIKSNKIDTIDLSNHKYIKTLRIYCCNLNSLILNKKIKNKDLKIYGSLNLNVYFK